MDEKAIAKRHRYLTVVADLERNRVLHLADDRKQESLDGFWATLTAEQVAGIEAMAMDIWEPYAQSTRAHLPDADRKIVFDKFHVAHLHDAVDQVRRGEHRALKRTGDDRLTGSKYLWLMRPKDMTPDQQTAFRILQRQDLKAARAWLLKERFAAFWGYTYPGAAEKFSARWYWRATHGRLKPMAGGAKLIKRHLPNLLTYLTHRITNAGLEAVNSVIQGVKKTARGFRNPEHFKIAIYFRCGGLDLYPPTRKPVEPINQQGFGQGAITNAITNVLAGTSHPVKLAIRSQSIAPDCLVSPPVALAPLKPLSNTLTLASVSIGGIPATVLFSGLAPGLTGLYQVNAIVPAEWRLDHRSPWCYSFRIRSARQLL